MHDQIGSAVVDEATAFVLIVEKWGKLRGELSFSILFENHLLLRLDNGEALVENFSAILLAHEGLEFGEGARRDIDHFLLGDTASCGTVLSFVLNGSGLLAGSSCLNAFLGDIRSLS